MIAARDSFYTVPKYSDLNRPLPLFVFFLLAIIFHVFLLYEYNKYPLVEPSIQNHAFTAHQRTPTLIIHMTSEAIPGQQDRTAVLSLPQQTQNVDAAQKVDNNSALAGTDVSRQPLIPPMPRTKIVKRSLGSSSLLGGPEQASLDLSINWDRINKFNRSEKVIHPAFLMPSESQGTLLASINRKNSAIEDTYMPNDSTVLLKVSQWGVTQCFEVRNRQDAFNDLTQDAWFYSTCL
ncbi:MAG: hypothetical protein ACC707_10310 [Thiohalomonadales bacterium]